MALLPLKKSSAADQAPSRSNPGAGAAERPLALTVICTLGFIGLLFSVPMAFSDLAARVGSWYPPYLLLSSVVELICMVGLWRMRRWSVYLYTGFFVIDQVLLVAMHLWIPITFFLPLFVVAAGFLYLRRMR